MKMFHPRQLIFSAMAAALFASVAAAAPIDFKEVSLLVRAHENDTAISQEVSQRKLLHPLTAAEEARLRTEGAGDSLLRTLRDSNNILAPQFAAAFEQERAQRAQAFKPSRNGESASEQSDGNFHVVDVAFGHPVNLSQWGGPDYEFAFNQPARLDEGQDDAVLINNAGSFTHVARYLGAGRPDDSTTIFDRRNYLSVIDHSLVRGLRIDRSNPVWRKGVPYVLYPVYAAGGVSLYYIGSSCDSVKLAIATR